MKMTSVATYFHLENLAVFRAPIYAEGFKKLEFFAPRALNIPFLLYFDFNDYYTNSVICDQEMNQIPISGLFYSYE